MNINLVRYNVRLFLGLLAQAIIFFSAAEDADIPRAWLLFIITFFYYIFLFIIPYRVNPALILQRGGSALPEDTKSWDKYIILAYTFLLYGQFFVAGWDLGHIQSRSLGIEYLGCGLALYALSITLAVWSLIENPFFEASVRIQKDRGQRVIESGPYKLVRHPGYLSGILWHLAMPMILGSGLALIYAVPIISLLFIRAYLEDETLQAELEGYEAYTGKTRYRILPGIW